MTTQTPTDEPIEIDQPRLPALRLLVGGALMGLANLVPGISGGTMLVAVGVYRRFVDAVSDATRLKLSRKTIFTLGLIVVAAMAAVGLGASPVAYGLEHARWAMYALFIGLTIGGVPALWALVRPICARTIAFALVGLAAMLAIVFIQETGTGTSGGGTNSNWLMLAIAGVAGAAAMVLPGVSGAYLLLLLGQYEAVVTAVKDLARGDLGALSTVIPIGIGVVVGIAGVSNLLRWLLHKYEKATLAVLLGLLLGAPAGLYPFREVVAPTITPAPGEVVSEEMIEELSTLETYTPSGAQIAASLGLITLGCAATIGVSYLGRRKDRSEPPAKPRH